jgi:hypothetical protein
MTDATEPDPLQPPQPSEAAPPLTEQGWMANEMALRIFSTETAAPDWPLVHGCSDVSKGLHGRVEANESISRTVEIENRVDHH